LAAHPSHYCGNRLPNVQAGAWGGLDDPNAFNAQHAWKADPGGIALARKQFGVVESEGFDLDQDPPWTRLWTGHTADLQHLRWSGMLKDNGSHEKPPLFSRHLFSSFVERFVARGGVILHATTSLLSNASLQAGMAQLRVNDVDKHAFHRQLGITGVAQAMGMDMLLNADCMR
jgi:hypothetical protein